MVASGLLDKSDNHAERCVEFALRMQQAASQVLSPAGEPLRLRIGIHSGPVVSGVVGKIRCRFCLFGAPPAALLSRLASCAIGCPK